MAQYRLMTQTVRENAIKAVQQAPDGWCVTIAPANRSLNQNAMQWPILTAFSEQVMWPVDGEMTELTPKEWKDVLTAAFKQEQPRLAQGLNGGVVMLGQRTSKFNKKQFSEWIEFLLYVAAERGVEV